VTSEAAPTNSGGGGGDEGDAGRSGEDGCTLGVSKEHSRQGRAEVGGGGGGGGGEGGGGKKGEDSDDSDEKRGSGGGSFAEMTQDVFGLERPRTMPAIPAIPAIPALPDFTPWTSFGFAVDAPPVLGLSGTGGLEPGTWQQAQNQSRNQSQAELQSHVGTGLVAWEGGEIQTKMRDVDLCECLFEMQRDLAILAFLTRELAENDHVVL